MLGTTITRGPACGEDDLTEREAQPSGYVLKRDVTENDLPIFFEHQWDPGATRMAAFPARDRGAFMAHWKRTLDDDTIAKGPCSLTGR